MVQQQHRVFRLQNARSTYEKSQRYNNNVLLCYQQPPPDLDWSESNREDITVDLHILLLKHFKDRKIKTILKTKSIFTC